MNITPGRVGGVTNALAIYEVAQKAGIPCWIGGMLESAVGVGYCIALAMLDNCTYPADIFPSSRFYDQDLADPPIVLSQSPEGIPTIRALTEFPEPVSDRLSTRTVQTATVH